MPINKEWNTRITFVADNELKEDIDRLIEIEKLKGRKVTVSSYIRKVMKQHVEQRSFFGVDDFPS